MKDRLFFVTTTLLTGLLFMSVVFANAGGETDPVVTKSYVDKKISEITTGGSGELSEYQMEFIIEEITNNLAGGNISTSGDTYVPVQASSGSIIIGEEGTEIILRSGKAVGYVEGSDGIVDITSGDELVNGSTVSKNHMLIIPRADGRGVKCSTDSWFIIKGGYTIR